MLVSALQASLLQQKHHLHFSQSRQCGGIVRLGRSYRALGLQHLCTLSFVYLSFPCRSCPNATPCKLGFHKDHGKDMHRRAPCRRALHAGLFLTLLPGSYLNLCAGARGANEGRSGSAGLPNSAAAQLRHASTA